MSEANKAKFTKGPWKMHSRSEVRFGGCGLISICNANNVEEYHNTALIAAATDMYHEIEGDIKRLTKEIEKISNWTPYPSLSIVNLERERDRKCDLLAKARGE